jgi:hypothetical protein
MPNPSASATDNIQLSLKSDDIRLLLQSLDHCLVTCTKKAAGAKDAPLRGLRSRQESAPAPVKTDFTIRSTMKKLTKPKPTKNCCQAAKVSKPAPEKSAQCCAKSSRLVAGCHD